MDKNTEYDYCIFIFRRDLRIEDNRGLIKMNNLCKEIIPIFIFDTNQVDINSNTKNYLSFPALRFLCESIEDLSNSIKKEKSKLNIFYGKPKNVIEYIIKYIKTDSMFKNKNICLGFNEDYTKYSLERDKIIEDICKKNDIDIIKNSDDYTLCDMELLKKNENEAYKQYGAFRKNMLDNKKKFNKVDNKKIKFIKKGVDLKKQIQIENLCEFWEDHINKEYKPIEVGKRKIGLKILDSLKKFKDYGEKRDTLSYETTHISAYLNFGLISEREFYYGLKDKLGEDTQLINQVIWRDYYYCLLRYLKGANSYDNHIDSRYDKIRITREIPSKTSQVWKEWNSMMQSKTGFLIVDAALREVILTGYMHNRCRMIVGVFSVKYLLINPLCRYIGLNDWFSRHLVDCNTSQNKLNCQWVTELDFPGKKFAPSSSPTAGRPMSISNDMIKKWDPECVYIKKWLPHLKDIDNKILYKWDTKYNDTIHPGPIFDAKERYKKWIKLCEK